MESRASTDHIEIGKTRRVKESLVTQKAPNYGSTQRSIYNILCHDGCEDFYYYIDWLDLAKGSDIVVLPKSTHYLYEAEDLEKTGTLINLKYLNQTKDLKGFISNIYQNISIDCYFAGCFYDNSGKNNPVLEKERILPGSPEEPLLNSDGVFPGSSYLNKLYQLLHLKGDTQLTIISVRTILKEANFTVLDITELNGKTYFCAQKRH